MGCKQEKPIATTSQGAGPCCPSNALPKQVLPPQVIARLKHAQLHHITCRLGSSQERGRCFGRLVGLVRFAAKQGPGAPGHTNIGIATGTHAIQK